MPNEFYLQDSRSYVGNNVLWWVKDGAGYTTDLSRAHVYTKEEAQRQHNCRETDIPWPKDYIDGKTRPAVDFQYLSCKSALAGTGIVLSPKKKMPAEKFRCHGCGRFMKIKSYYGGPCSNCGTDNKP